MDLPGVTPRLFALGTHATQNFILGGYYMSREDLESWSDREAGVNPAFKRCLDRNSGSVGLAVADYLRKQKLDHLVGRQHPPKAEHGACKATRCNNTNYIFYRRIAMIRTMTNFRPYDWEQFQETPFDQEVKAKLEQALNMTLPKWSMIVWGPRAMLYDPTPEMFNEKGDELVELLQNGPLGPCHVPQSSS
ncbi:hypothetical protein FS749_000859 [Ceratobasidium sp. UAMH 11750]|nr:hypothetical protein FS749_000859 [Ceratobasidium sp. UAMH 11750]